MALHKAHPKSVSSLLDQLLHRCHYQQHITYQEMIVVLGERAYGVLAVLFALPSALPISVIPGFSFVFGLPIVFIAMHLILARPTLYLPAYLGKKRVQSKTLAMVLEKAKPFILMLEHYLKARVDVLSKPWAERFIGFYLLILSLLLLLPIPFTNFFLSGLIILFGLGWSEKDGLVLLSAYILANLYLSGLGYLFLLGSRLAFGGS